MLRNLLFATIGFTPVLLTAQTTASYDASKYVLVDGRLLRGAVGYTSFGISDVDTFPERHGQGLNLRIEARLISGFKKSTEGFVIADAFFLDLTMGRLSSEPLSYYNSPESRFCTAVSMGYSFLAGYSTERFGVLGGKEIRWAMAMVGGTYLPGPTLFTTTAPWMARLEFRPAYSREFRIMLTGWDNFNADKRTKGFRVDIPFLPEKRFFLTYAFSRAMGEASYATFDNDQYAPGTFTQHMIGLRFGSIY